MDICKTIMKTISVSIYSNTIFIHRQELLYSYDLTLCYQYNYVKYHLPIHSDIPRMG